MTKFAYHRPKTLGEALALLDQLDHCALIAGGTDMMVRIHKRDLQPGALVSLSAIDGLDGIQPIESGIQIGALTTMAEITSHPRLAIDYPVLVQAASRVGSQQVRNRATIGGNLCNCSPCADTAGPLLVHQARLRLVNPHGEREIEVADFFEGPGQTCSPANEILSHILLPAPPQQAQAIFIKESRVCMDLAICSLSCLLDLADDTCQQARLAAGSVAPVPMRLTRVESFLQGKKIDPEVIEHAAQLAVDQVTPIDDIRASALHRRHLIGVFTKQALTEIHTR